MNLNRYEVYFFKDKEQFSKLSSKHQFEPYSVLFYPSKEKTSRKILFNFHVIQNNAYVYSSTCHLAFAKKNYLEDSPQLEFENDDYTHDYSNEDFTDYDITNYDIFNDYIDSGDYPFPYQNRKKHELISNSHSVLSALLKKEEVNVIRGRSLPNFFTSLREIDEYREMISIIGARNSLDVLSAINDLPTLRFSKRKPAWIKNLFEKYDLSSFFKKSSEKYLFSQAGQIVHLGIQQEKINSKIGSFPFEFKLPHFINNHRIPISFSTESDKIIFPINVLIGKNGIGKSQTLKKIVNFFSGQNDTTIKTQNNSILLNRLLVVDNALTRSSHFPSSIDNDFNLDYRKISLLDDERLGYDNVTTDVLDVILSNQHIAGKSRKDIFFESIAELGNINSIAMPFQKQGSKKIVQYFTLEQIQNGIDGIWFPITNHSQDNGPSFIIENEIYPLSSGQLSFIRLAAWLCKNVENGSLLLMDEPDIYLHPSLITQLVNLLHVILNSTGARAIIATHSAYIVREVPRYQVFVFKEEPDKIISIGSPSMNTVGANIGDISFFIFEETFHGALINEQLNKLLNKSERDLSNYVDDVFSLSAKMYLRRASKVEV